jgi:hypothetical protein
MNPKLQELIPAVVSFVLERDSYVTKTKLLKLLYLFDVEYFRLNRVIFTGFQWKYYHLGPWTDEYDPLLDHLIVQDLLIKRPSTNPDYIDAEFFRTSGYFDIEGIFSSYKDEFALKNILRTWGDKATAEILDYIYFHTEPIKYGERGKPLDFNTIEEHRPAEYKRASSGVSKEKIKALREEFETRLQTTQDPVNSKHSNFTPPKYDQEFFEAMEKLGELNF